MNGWKSRTTGGARLRPRGLLLSTFAALLTMAAVAAAAPTVNTLTPEVGSAAGGTRVTVTGSAFSTAAGATRINFGNKSGTAVACARPTLCQVTAPAGTGAVNVTAVFAGASNGVPFRYAPAITRLSPSGGSALGGTLVRIDGQGFTPGVNPGTGAAWTTFTFGGIPGINPSCSSTTSCQVTAPTTFAGNGTVDVIATGPVQFSPAAPMNLAVPATFSYLSSASNAAARFAYTVPAGTPVITSVSPGSGPATVRTPVTITGTGFSVTTGATTFRFGGTQAAGGTLATNVSCSSTTRCTATAPTGVGNVDVWARVNGLTSFLSAGAKYSYLDPPTITDITPGNGPQIGGNVVTVTGTGFVVNGTSFRFGTSAPATGTCDSTTLCTVTVPASPTFGVVGVSAISNGQPGPTSNYTYDEPPNPVITSVAPARATINGGNTVTINGAKLTAGGGPTVVTFDGVVAPITGPGGVCTLTQCIVTAPAHAAGLVDISVTTPGGVNTNTVADDFTFVPVINDPPFAGHSILAFTQRDFVSVDGFSASDAPYTISIIRGGNVISAVPNMTPDAAGLMEINHPGGSCWVGQTPDIVPGDFVRVTGQSGISEQTTVAGVKVDKNLVVTGAVPTITVTVHGTAQDTAGNPLPVAEIEHRFVVLDPKAKFQASGRRTMRAFSGGVPTADGTLAYDAPGSTHWTATYTFQSIADRDLAQSGSDSRVMWLGAGAAGVEGTIYESGSAIFGGPQAPCAAPWEPDTQAPTVPGGLTAVADGDPNGDNVTLAWDASMDNRDVTGYKVFRDGNLVATVGGDTLTYHDLHRPIGSYIYRVSAIDLAGNESAQTDPQTATTVASLAPDLDIAIAHVGSAFQIGQPGQYQITVSNAGTFAADGTFTVTDTLPAGLTLQTPVASASGTGPALDCSASTSATLSCSTTGTVVWNQGTSKQINLTVAVAAAAAGEALNTATIAFTPSVGAPGDSVTGNDSSTDAVIVDVAPAASGTIPPAGLRGIIAFPGRDFVSGTGYDPNDRITVELLRDSGSGYRVIARSRVQQPGADGILEINHPGGGCWSGDPQHMVGNLSAQFPYTPNMRPGDKVRYTSALHGYADETTIFGVNNGRPYNPAPGVIRYHGTAQDANGDPLPIDRLKARLVAGAGVGLFDGGTGARRSIEATNPASEGLVTYDAPGSINWTAEFTGLTQHDVDLALASEARTLYLGGDPLAGNDITIYERGANPGDVAKGPGAPCVAVADPETGVAPSVTTNPLPDLSIDSTHGDPFVVGTPNTYTLTVTNVGNATANANPFTPIKVIDTLPAGLGYLGTTSVGWTCSANGQKVTCDRTTAIAAGASASLVLQVSVGNAAVPTATNVATVSGPLDFESPNNRDNDDTVVNPFVAPAPDLTLAVSHDRRFTVGITDNSYLLKITNGLGPATAGPTTSAVRVVDTLPTGLTYNPVGSGGVNWACAAVGQTVTCDYAGAALADDGTTSDLRIFVNVAAAALAGDPVTNTVTNSATVSTVGGEELAATLSDNTAADSTVVRNNPSAPDNISIIAFPSRDFVSISGFDMGPDLVDPNDGDGQVTVQLWRNGALISTSGLMTPADDPTTPEADGIVDINHVGGADCWTGVTPDIRPGDVVRTVDARGVSYQITVLNARTDAAVAIDTDGDSVNDTVVAHGIATDAAGNRLSDAAFSNVEGRIVSSGGLFSNGKRTLRTSTDGVLSRTAGSIGFTASYFLGNGSPDIALAVAGETRVVASPNLLALVDLTIFENSPTTFGGPAVAGCAPTEGPTADLGLAIAAPGGLNNTPQTATVTVTNFGPVNSVNTVVTLDLPADVTNVTSGVGTVVVNGRVATVSIPSVTAVPVVITVSYTPSTSGTHVLAASTQSASADDNPGPTPGADIVAARIAVT